MQYIVVSQFKLLNFYIIVILYKVFTPCIVTFSAANVTFSAANVTFNAVDVTLC